MSERVVAVDVGNSAVKLCVRLPGDVSSANERIDTDYPVVSQSFALDGDRCGGLRAWVHEQLGEGRNQWRISSVHREASRRVEQEIGELAEGEAVHRIHRRQVPISLQVDQPDQLGIDRILGAYAALRRFEGPLVVVDAGTAITVDWVTGAGEFLGGAILPGIRLQIAALASGTDALPHVSGDRGLVDQGPATNTVDAIRLGVWGGIQGAIEHLARSYAQVAGGGGYKLIITGGDAHTIPVEGTRVQNLVCRGLLDLPRSSLPEANRCEKLE